MIAKDASICKGETSIDRQDSFECHMNYTPITCKLLLIETGFVCCPHLGGTNDKGNGADGVRGGQFRPFCRGKYSSEKCSACLRAGVLPENFQ